MDICQVTESNSDSTRALASIQRVEAIENHNKADSLELVTILGWQIITRKGEVKTGSKVIYCEIDSMLPVEATWLPVAVKDRIVKEQTKNFYRIKTIKLRGELSQGLIVPIVDTLPKDDSIENWEELEVGYNVTSLLKIEKYEPQVLTGDYCLYATARSTDNFPISLVNKTDEPRVQSNPKLFKALEGKSYYMTIKLDGTSVTYLMDPETGELMVCSRNMIRKRPENLKVCPYWYIANKYDIEKKLKKVPHVAIQGEICGPNIQHNLLGLKDLELFVFNVIDTRDRSKLSFYEMITICDEVLSVPRVPIEEVGDEFRCENIKVLLRKAVGTYNGTKNPREGLVVRNIDQTISFKAINDEYLLKYGY